MSRNWQRGKQWSDRFLPQIKRILGEYLIGEPPVEEDQKRNTDLIVLKMEAVRIACRVRRFGYREKYGQEFTIRWKTSNGHYSELSKIIEGFGQFFFYGFANEAEDGLAQWILGDLNVFRLWFNARLFEGCELDGAQGMPGLARTNIEEDATSFRAFCLDEVEYNNRPFVIASEGVHAHP